jgi:DMSO/TMAO reductase YedYZ molybdopterin-dependent catalytic subunit
MVADDTPVLFIMPDKITRVLSNLVDNAIRHAPQHSDLEIEVKRSTSASFVEVAVRDEGEGVSGENAERVFSVPNVQWKGVHLKSLIHLVKPSPQASYVHFYLFDGVYTESLSLSEALHPTVMLAYQLNGKPLSTKQGFPLRLVVPTMYGYKSIKWVNRVEFSDKPLVGYWEARGYSTEAYLGKGM